MWPYFLKEDEQLLIESFTQRWVLNGPGTHFVSPLHTAKVRKAVLLGPTDYLHIRDKLNGEIRIEIGPKLFFPRANDEIVQRLTAIALQPNQYLRLIDKRTGALRVERGETLVYRQPTEEVLEEAGDGIAIDERNTVLVQDTNTGQRAVIAAPQIFVPAAHQEIVEVRQRIPLKKSEYVRLIDKSSGVIRVERGEQSVVLGSTEELLDQVQEGINIDEHHAVLVRDTATGQLDLITAPQVFISAPNQAIVEVRPRILLEDHETVVVKNQAGQYDLRQGAEAERSFFLEPYSTLVQFNWSAGLHKDKRTLTLTHLDSRPKFMWYEFECRTQDNVELTIGITFFWQLVDVGSMIKTTDDAPGDVCSHARSAISQTPLEKFLVPLTRWCAGRCWMVGDRLFYEERGVKLHAVEVRNIACKDAATQKILHKGLLQLHLRDCVFRHFAN